MCPGCVPVIAVLRAAWCQIRYKARYSKGMASVHDVAAYILDRQGEMTAWKLQKLVYYSQAWHLVWNEEDEPLFGDRIEAWANGPVVYALFDSHRGQYTVSPESSAGDPDALSKPAKETIDSVLASYGHLSGRQLSALTHAEGPWKEARSGLGPVDRSSKEITLSSMAAYYGALDADPDAPDVADIDWSI